MLAVPIEENVARKNDESFYDENLEKILACLQLSEEIADNRKMMQVRITAFINPDILPVLSKIPIDQATVKQFHRAIFDEDTTSIQELLPEEKLDQNVLRNGLKRMRKFAEKIQVSNVRVLVDAEYRKGNSNFCVLDLPLNLIVEKSLRILNKAI